MAGGPNPPKRKRGFLGGFLSYLYEAEELKAFVLYAAFVTIFTMVSFMSKPGAVQFHLNQMYKGAVMGDDFGNIGSPGDVFTYLEGLGSSLYPTKDYGGAKLNPMERMTVAGGSGRTIGAFRLRQVRSKSVDCLSTPKKLTAMGEHEIKCRTPFDETTALKDPIHPVDSVAYSALKDFRQPFTYRSAEDLDTSVVVWHSGAYGSYSLDGYAVDFVPNISPKHFAGELSQCRPLLQESIYKCMQKFGVTYDMPPAPPPTPPPPAPPPTVNPGDSPTLGLRRGNSGNAVGDTLDRLGHTFVFTDPGASETLTFAIVNDGALLLDWEFNPSNFEVGGEEAKWLTTWLGTSPTKSGNVNSKGGEQFLQITATANADFFNSLGAGITAFDPQSPLTLTLQDKTFPNVRANLVLEVQYQKASRRSLFEASGSDEVCEEDAPVNDLVPPALSPYLDQCELVADPNNFCNLNSISFQQMLKFMQPGKCGECKCKTHTDAACVSKCAPSELFLDQVKELKTNKWIDEYTRAVMLDVTIFTTEHNLFTTVTPMVEFPEIGGTFPDSSIVKTYKVYRYVTSFDNMVQILEYVFVGLIAFYTLEELWELYKKRFSYFGDVWNYVSWANLIILYVVLALRVGSLLILNAFDFDGATVQYVDFPPIAEFATQELNVSSLNYFLMYISFFKFMQNVPRMNAILLTISSAAFDLLLFMVMAIVVQFGFSCAFYVCFGAQLSQYSTFGEATGTLAKTLLGDFDYEAMSEANSTMAPVLFYLYQLFVFFILLNMFLAIINDSYAEVKENQTDEDLHFYARKMEEFRQAMARLFSRREKLNKLSKQLTAADTDADQMVDEDELKEVFKNHPELLEVVESEGVGEFLKKHDINSDGVLDKQEMQVLLQELVSRLDAEEEGVKEDMEETSEDVNANTRAARRKNLVSGGEYGDGGDLGPVNERIDKVEGQIKEMSRNLAKKLSLMIDLMMSLSDQIVTTNNASGAQALTKKD